MIVAYDAKRAYRNNTGLGNYSRMVIKNYALSHPDDKLVLFTPSTKGREEFFADLRNVRVVTPKGLWMLVPSLWRTLGVGIRRSGAELFHGLSHELPLFVPRKVRTVVTMHDLIVWRYPELFPFVDRYIYKKKQRHSCRKADAIVAVSSQTARDIKTYIKGSGSQYVTVISQSADRIFYEPVSDGEVEEVCRLYDLPAKFILCVGTVERRKNQLAVVRAFSQLSGDWRLLIVGRQTGYAEEVKTLCMELGVEGRVQLRSDIAFVHFPALYRAAAVSIYVSYFEGFGIPVLESLCCGTPVVASDRSSLPEVGGSAALYADPDSPDDIAECLKRLTGDELLCCELKKNAAEQVELYSAANVVKQLFELYSRVLSRQ